VTTHAPSGTERPEGAAAHRRIARRALGTVPGVRWLVAGIVTVSLACALLARILAGDDFPTISIAFWWALQTVTTVGYGDTVPDSAIGKTIGGALMIAGVAAISLITAAISAAWVTRLQARRRAVVGDPVMEALERIEQRLQALEQRTPGA
jgi:voltage-gated potassium channel